MSFSTETSILLGYGFNRVPFSVMLIPGEDHGGERAAAQLTLLASVDNEILDRVKEV
jgi:hypothetical protein